MNINPVANKQQQKRRILNKSSKRRRWRETNNLCHNDPILFFAFIAFGILIVVIFFFISIFPSTPTLTLIEQQQQQQQQQFERKDFIAPLEIEAEQPLEPADEPNEIVVIEDLDEPESNFPTQYLDSSSSSTTKTTTTTTILNSTTTTTTSTPYRPKGGMRFEEWKDGSTPYTITTKLKHKSNTIARQRKIHIRNAMKHAWDGYKTHAFGADEVNPITGGTKYHWGDIGTTLIDSLDTLWLMDMKDEFWECRDWVRDHLNQDVNVDASVFETTIRSLGGLLGAYAWSRDEVFLNKATDMGQRLFKAFPAGSELGVPSELVNLHTGRRSNANWLGPKYILSEMGTIQMEFRDLAHETRNESYALKSEYVFKLLKEIEPEDGLFPYFLTYSGGRLHFDTNDVSFGAFGDSFFEYELKLWLQGGRKEPTYREMYDKSMDGMHAQLLYQSSSPSGLWYIGTRSDKNKFEHLTCFMGGLLALGAYTDPNGLDSPRAQRDLKTSKQLAYTCYQMYAQTPTGLAPDEITFTSRLRGKKNQAFSIQKFDYGLRPETIETFFLLNKLTGDPIYREWGWEIFQSIESYCKTDVAYGKYPNVQDAELKPGDQMESFFLGETLKYLYLLNDPDTEVDILNKHVFNTEAHPLMVFE